MSSRFSLRFGDGALVGSLSLLSIAGGLFLPLSLVFFLQLTDIPLELLGVILGAAGVVSLPVPALAGRLADRFGARRLVVMALVLQSMAYAGFAVAREPLFVLVVTTLIALGGRLFWSTVFTALADHSGDDAVRRNRWFAIANITRTAGIATGGLLTGLVLIAPTDELYVRLAVTAAGCLAVSAALFSRVPHARLLSPSQQPTAAPRLGMLRNRSFVELVAVNTVFATSTLLLGLSLPTVVDVALELAGIVTAALLVGNAVLVAACGLVGARWASTRPPRRVLATAAAIWAAGCALIGIAVGPGFQTWALMLIVFGVTAFSAAEVLHAPTSVGLATELAPAASRGTYLALFQYSFVAAEIISPVLFTGLFVANHSAPFIVVLALNLAVIPVVIRRARGRLRSG
jgi:MFS family permease